MGNIIYRILTCIVLIKTSGKYISPLHKKHQLALSFLGKTPRISTRLTSNKDHYDFFLHEKLSLSKSEKTGKNMEVFLKVSKSMRCYTSIESSFSLGNEIVALLGLVLIRKSYSIYYGSISPISFSD